VDGGGNVDTLPINAGQSDTAILSGPMTEGSRHLKKKKRDLSLQLPTSGYRFLVRLKRFKKCNFTSLCRGATFI